MFCVSTGSIIPPSAISALERVLSQDSARAYTEKHNTPFNYQPYIPNSGNNKSGSSHLSQTVSKSASLSSSDTISNTNGSNSAADEQPSEPPELLSMPTLVW